MEPVIPADTSVAVTVYTPELAAAGVPVSRAVPDEEDIDNPDGRPVARIELIPVPVPNTVLALNRYAEVVGTGSPTVSVGRYTLLDGRVKITVGVYENVNDVELDRRPANMLVASTPSVYCSRLDVMPMGESIVGVPVRMTVPEGSVGAKEYDTEFPEMSVNPRPLGTDGREYIKLDAVTGIAAVNMTGTIGAPTVSVLVTGPPDSWTRSGLI